MKRILKTILCIAAFTASVSGLNAQTHTTPGPAYEQKVSDKYTHPKDENGNDIEGLWYSKIVQGPNPKGEYMIYLKTFVEGEVSTDVRHIPSDIILVLDVSGSMAWKIGSDTDPGWGENSRLDELKTAVADFIDQIKTDADNNGVDNQIAVVKFARDTYYYPNANWSTTDKQREEYLGEGSHRDNSGRHYTEVVKAFTPVKGNTGNKTNQQLIKEAVDGIVESDNGATAADYGMRKAELLLNDFISKNSSRESNKIVVLFTDGSPTYSTGFQDGVANSAITIAKRIKATKAYSTQQGDVNAKVYTIGLFNSDAGKIKTYMERVSSNYPDATGIEEGKAGSLDSENYYFKVENKEELQNAFAAISTDSASPIVELNSSSTVVDVVSKSFSIPKGNLPVGEGTHSEIQVYEAPCTGQVNGKFTFSMSGWKNITDDITFNDGPNNTVSISGWSFSNNAVALGTNNRPLGKELIIEIPIEMSTSAVGGHGVGTNGPGSGITYTDDEGEHKAIFSTPDLNLPINIQIRKEGLKVGESAKFTIQRKWNGTGTAPSGAPTVWTDYTSVFVTRRSTDAVSGESAPTATIIGLHPDYLYKIKEDAWSWSYGLSEVYGYKYDPDTEATTKVSTKAEGSQAAGWTIDSITSDKINLNPFIFANDQKKDIDTSIRHAESIVTNDFKDVSGTATGATTNSKAQPKQ